MRNHPPLMPSGSKQSVEDGVKGCCIPLAFLAAQMADGPLVDFWSIWQSHSMIWNAQTMWPLFILQFFRCILHTHPPTHRHIDIAHCINIKEYQGHPVFSCSLVQALVLEFFLEIKTVYLQSHTENCYLLFIEAQIVIDVGAADTSPAYLMLTGVTLEGCLMKEAFRRQELLKIVRRTPADDADGFVKVRFSASGGLKFFPP